MTAFVFSPAAESTSYSTGSSCFEKRRPRRRDDGRGTRARTRDGRGQRKARRRRRRRSPRRGGCPHEKKKRINREFPVFGRTPAFVRHAGGARWRVRHIAPRGTDADEESRNDATARPDAGARAFLRRSRPRASPDSLRSRCPSESGRARLGRREGAGTLAPGARARKSAQKARRSRREKTEEPADGARARTSRRERKPSEWIAVWCTKMSSEPSSGVMNPNPFWVLNHFTCARRRREESVSARAIEATIASLGRFDVKIRGEKPPGGKGSAREASEEAGRCAPRKHQFTLPVSFVIVFRGRNCDGGSGARGAMVPSAVVTTTVVSSCHKSESIRLRSLKALTLSPHRFREDIFPEFPGQSVFFKPAAVVFTRRDTSQNRHKQKTRPGPHHHTSCHRV